MFNIGDGKDLAEGKLTPAKKLRFRAVAKENKNAAGAAVEDISDDDDAEMLRRKQNYNNRASSICGASSNKQTQQQQQQHKYDELASAHATAPAALLNQGNALERERPSFMDFFKVEMTRGYMLEHDEERYSARRQKIYSFLRIPRDLERFMVYGLMQCADSFLYIHTFLPVRFLLAMWGLFTRPIAACFGLRRRNLRLLAPAEVCDLLKCFIWIVCTMVMLSVDTNYVYHIIKSQSIIKLYIFYNMLEVGDRLLSAFGQDIMDAMYWTATEPKNSKRAHLGVLTHILFALAYVMIHSFLIMFEATTLNVAVNSSNKALLTIMISNNFVELKGSVFKKFDKNNLFQLTCSDVRERFHLSVLLFIVLIQTMKEFDWSLLQFSVMLPDCFAVLFTEILIDWIKHAFITRFNEIPEGVYREYTTSLAYDMTQTRQKHAFSDHSDLVARRMGFIPFPLSVVLVKAVHTAVFFENFASYLVFGLAFLFVLGLRICLMICALGKACKLMREHQEEKSSSTPSSMTNMAPIVVGATLSAPNSRINQANNPRAWSALNTTPVSSITMPPPPLLQRSATVDMSCYENTFSPSHSNLASTPKQKHNNALNHSHVNATSNANDIELDVKNSLELGATALFSNSDVDLDDVCLNEHVLDTGSNASLNVDSDMAHSEPELFQQEDSFSDASSLPASSLQAPLKRLTKRTHKRSESEPAIQNIGNALEQQSL